MLSDVVAYRVTIVEELATTLALAHVIRSRNERHHCLLALRPLLYCSPAECMIRYSEHEHILMYLCLHSIRTDLRLALSERFQSVVLANVISDVIATVK